MGLPRQTTKVLLWWSRGVIETPVSRPFILTLGHLRPTSIDIIYTLVLMLCQALFRWWRWQHSFSTHQLPSPLNRGMSKTSITCEQCGIAFDKRTADYNKQRRKNPDCKFYCTLSCHGKRNANHLHGLHSFTDYPEKQQRASAKSVIVNKKYFGRDLPLSTLLRKCRNRGREFNLTIEILAKIWDAQNERCALSNIPLDLYSSSYINMPSIDRIDSTLGYIESNIQFVSCAINLAKSNMSNDDALKLLDLICEHYPPNSDVSTETETGG